MLHLLNDRVIVIGTCRLDCFLADRRQIKIGNEPCRFIRVCAEKDVADTNVPVIDPKLTERIEALERGELLPIVGIQLAYLQRRTRLQ